MVEIFKDARKQEYLHQEGADKPLKSPIPDATLEAARAYRLARLREQLETHDCAALLLYDPVNVRYAFDAPNMQVWSLHNAVRYALIFVDGPGIMFEFKGAEHLSSDKPGIDEIRHAIAWDYMSGGERSAEFVADWSDEIDHLLRAHGGGNRRLAVDRLEPMGVRALEDHGIELVEGQQLTEVARSIKSADELTLMRWTIRVCEAGMARVYENSLPGKTEQEIWAELHCENARSGGEWIETRLLTSGARTNPWYSECSDHVCREGDIISFDTDMIGPYGYCADLSRSWTCGHTRMTTKQRELYGAALDQINHNLSVLQVGMSFRAFNERSWRIPEKYQPYRYTVALHGVGMADEWPLVLLHPDFGEAYGGRFEENMVVCVESLIGEADSECIKLETQAVLTPQGAERLDSFPWEDI
ncbi:MAG: Xaa-Pro peptidase family protein [Hyphomicrobiaceae bacterium]